MSVDKVTIFAILRRIQEALESLSNEEIERLSDPTYSLEIRTIRKRNREDANTTISDNVVRETIATLTGLPSRQDAQALLNERFPTKKNLEAIARKLDIPIVRQDKVDALRDKIVEATVGARIRSQAIQGTGA